MFAITLMKFKYPLEKIVVNTGLGRLSSQNEFEKKILPEAIKDLAAITGQKPQTRAAKKSISGFKLRQGAVVGLKVTLRRRRANQFLEKVVNVVLPRIRDFRGLTLKSIDKNNNLTFGIKEHIVFPEIAPEAANVSFGLQITLVPRARFKNQDEAIKFYRNLGVPLQKK